ncbi:hypothetical protein K431DRAFT_348468 [Polychaeton citri CBS 116435]|uniref:Uncharacterized protein n=1 Tax=Polychaeton citri CBS 116435 TaxID=1314669 RepID=A0A9P4ULP4_9PEZI|nr:hypothetical protein K431DRAFT_348468 [Polychaeton citri CBS 116435]
MSTTRNTDSISNQMPGGGSGEIHARVPRDEPITTSGHKPGKLVGNDAVPEFSAQTLPAGSAPADRTFQPNTGSEVPPVDPSGTASASETLGGATSAEVHTGLGHPGQGQTSQELHHDGQAGRKNPGSSLEGVGATVKQSGINAHDPAFANQRALDKDEAVVGRGNVGGPPAEERLPESL